MSWRVFVAFGAAQVLLSTTYRYIAVCAEDGSALVSLDFEHWGARAQQLGWPGRTVLLDRQCLPFLLAVSFMNCRNVRLDWVHPPAALAKAFRRRNRGANLSPYRIIDILPMTRLLSTLKSSDAEGDAMRFQTVRGHFKRYSQNGLFGKHKGTFFFPSHERGSADRETRHGHYRIRTDKGK
jgi:hypothetical protein